MAKKLSKEDEYAMKICEKIKELIDDCEISPDELAECENLTHFFHALSNIVPTFFYYKLTGEEKNILDINHLANKLILQYSNKYHETRNSENSK